MGRSRSSHSTHLQRRCCAITRDKGTGIISIVIGLLVAVMAHALPVAKVQGDVGPSFFPYITAGLLIICGAGLLIQKRTQAPPFLTKAQWKRFCVLVGVYLGYLLLLWSVGFLIATPICLFTTSSLFAQGKNVALWKRLLFSLLLTAMLYILFYTLMGLKLPVGKFIRLSL